MELVSVVLHECHGRVAVIGIVMCMLQPREMVSVICLPGCRLRVCLIYNLFPTFDNIQSWRRRVACLALLFGARDSLKRLRERLG